MSQPFCPAHPDPNCPKKNEEGRCEYCGYDFEMEYLLAEDADNARKQAVTIAKQKNKEHKNISIAIRNQEAIICNVPGQGELIRNEQNTSVFSQIIGKDSELDQPRLTWNDLAIGRKAFLLLFLAVSSPLYMLPLNKLSVTPGHFLGGASPYVTALIDFIVFPMLIIAPILITLGAIIVWVKMSTIIFGYIFTYAFSALLYEKHPLLGIGFVAILFASIIFQPGAVRKLYREAMNLNTLSRDGI